MVQVDDVVSDLESIKDYDRIVKLLSSDNPKERGLAAEALGRLGNPTYLPDLEKMLANETKRKVVEKAKWAVGELKNIQRKKSISSTYKKIEKYTKLDPEHSDSERYPNLVLVAYIYRIVSLLLLLIIPALVVLSFQLIVILVISVILILNVVFSYAGAELIELLISIESHVVKIAKRK